MAERDRLSMNQCGATHQRLKDRGQVTPSEFADYVKAKDALLDDIENEVAAYMRTDRNTYEKGIGIIELFTNIPKIMDLDDNLLVKARLAEIVLSNKTLVGGTLRYDYEKPFDDLLKLTGSRGWW
jgi:hypothetical protein